MHVNRLSDQVAAVLEHYKSADPVGMPGAPIPDPMPVPDMKKDIPFSGTLTLKNQSVYGLSKFRIESAYSNLADMEVVKFLANYLYYCVLFKSLAIKEYIMVLISLYAGNSNIYAVCRL